jgi:ankyrin repeat protein
VPRFILLSEGRQLLVFLHVVDAVYGFDVFLTRTRFLSSIQEGVSLILRSGIFCALTLLISYAIITGAVSKPRQAWKGVKKMKKLAAVIIALAITATLGTIVHSQSATDDLFAAIEKNDIQKVRYLIPMGADVNARDPYASMSPLMMAAYDGYTEIARLLIEKGADVNAKGGVDMDMTPLIYAASQDRVDMVKMLLEKGANVNAKTQYGWTPFFFAASQGRVDIAKLLIDKGADVNVKLPTGETALSAAEQKGYAEMVKLLRQAGAK